MTNQNDEVLKLVKMRLGITSEVRDDFLTHLIRSSLIETYKKGVVVNFNNDAFLSYIVDLSCFKYKNNDFNELPKYLRYQLNNLLLGSVKNDL